jgi:hypothetical protein
VSSGSANGSASGFSFEDDSGGSSQDSDYALPPGLVSSSSSSGGGSGIGLLAAVPEAQQPLPLPQHPQQQMALDTGEAEVGSLPSLAAWGSSNSFLFPPPPEAAAAATVAQQLGGPTAWQQALPAGINLGDIGCGFALPHALLLPMPAGAIGQALGGWATAHNSSRSDAQLLQQEVALLRHEVVLLQAQVHALQLAPAAGAAGAAQLMLQQCHCNAQQYQKCSPPPQLASLQPAQQQALQQEQDWAVEPLAAALQANGELGTGAGTSASASAFTDGLLQGYEALSAAQPGVQAMVSGDSTPDRAGAQAWIEAEAAIDRLIAEAEAEVWSACSQASSGMEVEPPPPCPLQQHQHPQQHPPQQQKERQLDTELALAKPAGHPAAAVCAMQWDALRSRSSSPARLAMVPTISRFCTLGTGVCWLMRQTGCCRRPRRHFFAATATERGLPVVLCRSV